MRSIKKVAEEIREELEDAKNYAEKAVKLRDKDMTSASVYAELSRQELGHADKLHEMAVRLINEQRAAGVAPPVAMQAVWDWEHENMINKTVRIKMLLDTVK